MMGSPIKITYVNRSMNQNLPKIFLFLKNDIPTFDALRDAVAWRVIDRIGRGSSCTFHFPTETVVSASWNDHTCQTARLNCTIGKRYCVVEDETGITIQEDDDPRAIDVVNQTHMPGGVSIDLYKNGKLMMRKKTADYGQKATFVPNSKLYWGLASEVEEGEPLSSAVLNSDCFFEQDLEGVTEATVVLRGNAEDGYRFVIEDWKGRNSMSDKIKITYVNRSISQTTPKVFLFVKNGIPTFDALRDAVAWRVIDRIGRGSSCTFHFPTETVVSASWNDHTCQTAKLNCTIGKRYCVVEDETGITIQEDNDPRAIDVVNQTHVPGGISVDLYKDGKLMMRKKAVDYGQKATFVLNSKLYWGLASEIEEGKPLSSAILNSDCFFEQNLEGVTEATVVLRGNAEDGYRFVVEDRK